MKIYFIVTTSLIEENFEARKQEYIIALNSLFKSLESQTKYKFQVIIVENNGERKTFLNELYPQAKIFYTTNNKLKTNKGIKELADIYSTINNFNIGDEDMIVKLTGRYIINSNSCFMNELFTNAEIYDCIIKLGSIIDYRTQVKILDSFDCYTGLFAIKCKYLKLGIPYYLLNNKDYEWVEWIIVSIIHTNIPNKKIKFIDKLDLIVKPAGQTTSNLI